MFASWKSVKPARFLYTTPCTHSHGNYLSGSASGVALNGGLLKRGSILLSVPRPPSSMTSMHTSLFRGTPTRLYFRNSATAGRSVTQGLKQKFWHRAHQSTTRFRRLSAERQPTWTSDLSSNKIIKSQSALNGMRKAVNPMRRWLRFNAMPAQKGATDLDWRHVPKLHHYHYFERAAALGDVDHIGYSPYVSSTDPPQSCPPPSAVCPQRWLQQEQRMVYRPPSLSERVATTSIPADDPGFARMKRRAFAWGANKPGEVKNSVPGQQDMPYLFRPNIDPRQFW
eukprot:TRINITY_DN2983_c0_g1_i2.p1 TRINITY_DN2983_c0_g1~~TRINITY_DN2983_c0_g1_i2.p1  ORF type:complete len:283 (-),score=9.46 TRINITY_DN2983_c0_g1_i2:176-1024(-)